MQSPSFSLAGRVAAVTGVSFETSKTRLRYARMKLRDLLQEHA